MRRSRAYTHELSRLRAGSPRTGLPASLMRLQRASQAPTQRLIRADNASIRRLPDVYLAPTSAYMS